MKKKIKCLLGIVILLGLIGWYSVVDKQIPVYDSEIPTEEYVQLAELTNKNSVSQSFYNEKNTLNAVSLKCYVNSSVPDEELTYILYDEEGKEISINSIKIGSIENGKFTDFAFEEISNCEGKKYTFEILYEKDNGSGVYLYKTSVSDSNLELKENQEEIEGTLVMRTITRMFDIETFFVVMCFAIYIILFIRMLYKFFR